MYNDVMFTQACQTLNINSLRHCSSQLFRLAAVFTYARGYASSGIFFFPLSAPSTVVRQVECTHPWSRFGQYVSDTNRRPQRSSPSCRFLSADVPYAVYFSRQTPICGSHSTAIPCSIHSTCIRARGFFPWLAFLLWSSFEWTT